MEKAKELRDQFLAAGGAAEDFERLGRGGLRLEEGALQDGSTRPQEASAMTAAIRPGSLIEYHCYDTRGRGQGVAVVCFEQWLDQAELKFRGSHLKASDDYYEYWAQQNLVSDQTCYHFCLCTRSRCRVGDPRGIETIHITKWRLVSPQTLVGGGYASEQGLAHLQRELNDFLAHKPAAPPGGAPPFPPRPPGGHRSGLDDYLDLVDPPPGPGAGDADLDRLAREAHTGRGRDRNKKSPDRPVKAGFGQVLMGRAKEHEEARAARRRKRSGSGRREKADDPEEVRKKKQKNLDEDSYDGSSSEGGQVFRGASSREVDLDKMSRRDPGCPLRSALREMSKYLAARGEANMEEPAQGRILSYLHQILLPQHPKAGLRAQRELVTLASAMDLLIEGDLGRCGDLLAQRFKAIEAAIAAEGNWSVARHHEIIPSNASLSTPAELTQAAKAEIRAQKLRQQISKQSKRRRGQVQFNEKVQEIPKSPKTQLKSPEKDLPEQTRVGALKTVELKPAEAGAAEEPTEDAEWQEVRSFCTLLAPQPGQQVHVAGTVGAWKDILPLPVDEDVLELVRGIVSDGEFKMQKSKMSGGAIKLKYRAVGIDCLVFLMTCGLNVLWGGLRGSARLPRGPARPSQRAAIDRLREAACYMVDSQDGNSKGGIPRTPEGKWEEKVKDARISYHGEVIAKAEALELDRVLASLPPKVLVLL
eukprot:s793_g12.t1